MGSTWFANSGPKLLNPRVLERTMDEHLHGFRNRFNGGFRYGPFSEPSDPIASNEPNEKLFKTRSFSKSRGRSQIPYNQGCASHGSPDPNPNLVPTLTLTEPTRTPGSLAPGSLAPGSLASGSLAPGSLAPGSLAPGSLAPDP